MDIMKSKMSIDTLGEYLKDNGVKPSYQRLKIFEYLVQNKNHPTVDTIHRSLLPHIPTLSKTTVYNTLSLFIEKGITQLITIEENEGRYDADVASHGHFKCLECSNVYDFEFEIKDSGVNGIEGFKVDEKHLYFKGVCKDCLSRK